MAFANSKKLESIVDSFVFCIKISCQSKESPLSKESPSFSPTPPFLEKIFHLHPYCQTTGSQSPPPHSPHPHFVKGEVGNMKKNPPPLFLTDSVNLDGIY